MRISWTCGAIVSVCTLAGAANGAIEGLLLGTDVASFCRRRDESRLDCNPRRCGPHREGRAWRRCRRACRGHSPGRRRAVGRRGARSLEPHLVEMPRARPPRYHRSPGPARLDSPGSRLFGLPLGLDRSIDFDRLVGGGRHDGRRPREHQGRRRIAAADRGLGHRADTGPRVRRSRSSSRRGAGCVDCRIVMGAALQPRPRRHR